jgi:hypothetical protein
VGREYGDSSVVEYRAVAAVSRDTQGLVEAMASEAETALDAAATDTGRLPRLPVSGSRKGTGAQPGASAVVGGEEPTRTTEGPWQQRASLYGATL